MLKVNIICFSYGFFNYLQSKKVDNVRFAADLCTELLPTDEDIILLLHPNSYSSRYNKEKDIDMEWDANFNYYVKELAVTRRFAEKQVYLKNASQEAIRMKPANIIKLIELTLTQFLENENREETRIINSGTISSITYLTLEKEDAIIRKGLSDIKYNVPFYPKNCVLDCNNRLKII